MIMTVTGPLEGRPSGSVLIHEHVLVSFIGAERIAFEHYDPQDAVDEILPHLERAKSLGLALMAECTPSYLGRNPLLLRRLSAETGILFVTNTGYYGGRDGAFLPAHAYRESAESLAERWIDEWQNGIDGTGVKPGFIKIAVNEAGSLSGMDRKLVRAAAIAHRATGLTIASHTKAGPVLEELEVLRCEGVDPSAFIWVHAHDEKDLRRHVAAAQLGAWVEFDAVGDSPSLHVELIERMKDAGLLNRVLISHDAGWYEPGNPARQFKGYEPLFDRLLPALKERQFDERELDLLLVTNPVEALSVRTRILAGAI